LPNLAALERNFKNALIGIVRQTLHLRIEDLDPFSYDRSNKMRAVFNPLLAFLSEDHRRENLAGRYTEHLFGWSTASFIYMSVMKPKKEEP